jgi:hypothetical protein
MAADYSCLAKTLPGSFLFCRQYAQETLDRQAFYKRSDYTYPGVYERTEPHGLFVPSCRVAPTSRSHWRTSCECWTRCSE